MKKKSYKLQYTKLQTKKQRQSWFASRYFYAANHDCLNQKFLQGDLLGESVGQWVSRSVMKSLLERSLMSVVSKVSVVSELRRLKASIAVLKGNSKALYYIRHFTTFPADSVHLKKPSVGPKGLIGPPCHGALAAGGNNENLDDNKKRV
jgi:hypothetical protein